MTFGIIGFGRFGKLWAEALSKFGEVLIYDKSTKIIRENSKIKLVSVEQVCKAPILFLLVPISQMENCCQQIKKYLLPQTLVVDCCSVKMFPAKILKKIFKKNQPLIATHPLFGPDSAKRNGGTINGLKIVVCQLRVNSEQRKSFIDLLTNLKLKVIQTTPRDHDQQMAFSQSLVHFMGRGLANLHLKPQEISTPDFVILLNMNDMVVNDTKQLFMDMQRFNPFAKKVRRKLILGLNKLEKEISYAK